jgi:tRNA threonylcarbamoyladenosine biosynthesis protein TsaB
MRAVGWAEVDTQGPRPEVRRFASFVAEAEPGHAETLLDRMRAALAAGNIGLDDVELLVFGRGPGTFTGLRIGLGTAKGMALALGTKLVGISSLEALALSAGGDGLIAPLIDARRGELYAALYEVRFERHAYSASLVVAEQVVRPEEVAAFLQKRDIDGPIRFAGNGALRYAEVLRPLGEIPPVERSAADPLRMAIAGVERYLREGSDDPVALEPSYLRAPDAKLPKPTF